MERESQELQHPSTEAAGQHVSDIQIINGEYVVTFSCRIQASQPPTVDNVNFIELIEQAGGWEIFRKKKWADEHNRALVPLTQRVQCVQEGPNTYRTHITFMRDNSV